MIKLLPFSRDILYKLASANDLPVLISGYKESTESTEFADTLQSGRRTPCLSSSPTVSINGSTTLNECLSTDTPQTIVLLYEVHIHDIEYFSFLNHALEKLWPLRARLVLDRQFSAVLIGYLWISSIVSSLSAPNRTPKKTLSKPYKYGTYKIPFTCGCLTIAQVPRRECHPYSRATSVLTYMAMQTTLRYSFNLTSCAQMLARKRKAEQVGVEGLRWAYTDFMNERRSVQWLKEQQGSLVLEEIPATNEYVMDSS